MERIQIFDKVEARLNDGTGAALLTRYKNDFQNNFQCTYRNEDGLRCAVGIFLPDNEEMLKYEGSVYDLVSNFRYHPDFPSFIEENLMLMRDLQIIHDNPKNWNGNIFNERGKEKLKELKDECLGKAD